MPFYEYICPLCGHEFEQLQKFSDAPLTNCPTCHQEGLQKKISAPAFHLKGTGWYVTDFKDGAKPKEKSDNKAVKSDDAAATSADKPSADTKASTESKPESTSDVKPKTSTDEK